MSRRRHPPEFKLGVVQQLERGERSAAQLCREHDLSHSLISRWQAVYERYRSGAFDQQQPRTLLSLERLLGQAYAENAFLKNAYTA